MISVEGVAYAWALLWSDRADDAMEILKQMLTDKQRDDALLELQKQDASDEKLLGD